MPWIATTGHCREDHQHRGVEHPVLGQEQRERVAHDDREGDPGHQARAGPHLRDPRRTPARSAPRVRGTPPATSRRSTSRSGRPTRGPAGRTGSGCPVPCSACTSAVRTCGTTRSESGTTTTGIQNSQTEMRCHRRSGMPVGKVANMLMNAPDATVEAVSPTRLKIGYHGSRITSGFVEHERLERRAHGHRGRRPREEQRRARRGGRQQPHAEREQRHDAEQRPGEGRIRGAGEESARDHDVQQGRRSERRQGCEPSPPAEHTPIAPPPSTRAGEGPPTALRGWPP